MCDLLYSVGIHCVCELFLSATISVDSSSASVLRKVEKVSQNMDMDMDMENMPVCFDDFKKCNVNFNFK